MEKFSELNIIRKKSRQWVKNAKKFYKSMKPKKRIIFTLLYSNGFFVLSRNFQIQKIGKISWLKKNFNFLKITKAIDELIVLNIRDKKKTLIIFVK